MFYELSYDWKINFATGRAVGAVIAISKHSVLYREPWFKPLSLYQRVLIWIFFALNTHFTGNNLIDFLQHVSALWWHSVNHVIDFELWKRSYKTLLECLVHGGHCPFSAPLTLLGGTCPCCPPPISLPLVSITN